MAITEVKRLAQALSKDYNTPNPDLAKCGQHLSQLKVSKQLPCFRVNALQRVVRGICAKYLWF